MVWIPLINSTVATFPLGLPDQNVTDLMEIVGFQQAPNLRGTMSIIMSCATVLIIALYNSYHPTDVHEQVWITSVAMTFMAMLMPEFCVRMAVQQYFDVRRNTAYFKNTLKLPRWTHVHSFVLIMGRFSITLPSGTSQPILNTKGELAEFVRNGGLQDTDLPTASQLKELSKLNVLVKIFTIVQVSWLVVQCFARWVSHLPVTLLELMTSCYAICAIVTYLLWLDKPYRMDDRPYFIACSGIEDALKEPLLNENKNLGRWNTVKMEEFLGLVSYVLTSATLSFLHFLAWNSHFPTEIERRMWHITSIVHVAAFGMAAIREFIDADRGRIMFIVVSSLSRLLLFALSIASLRAMPAGAYIQPAWTTFIPHFS
ncbi:hypothetical protein DL96DRAFT_1589917 [Flagelloscypha sp. PMI_526]|nr:hypothetical protein DL96DRAFT_1589917 [Flagelloscypha sp. PMI_526]